ncbi:Methyltransferase-like protein 6 [Dimargaris verticillata]|uniref:tRNA N(3)-methylcytidine methyltransferase n=1 Tax=Dimargaris verticillata TaxID=2761393 RepID=A0A9W8B5A9_9FUNG|nr:Methyltransferase-like protein 6 [Dimargaris verticillata]
MDEDYVRQAQAALAKDTSTVPKFWVQKYRQEAAKNWDKFYKRNTTNFFKDRHWVDREFEELRYCEGSDTKKILEVGCGVGNFIFPLLEINPGLFVYACDFSPRAVEMVKSNAQYDTTRCHAFVCDLTANKLSDTMPPATIDLVSMIFVLSAIPPEKMADAIGNIYQVMAPGGVVLFRDYGIYDAAQLRFKPGSKLDENHYVRQDGTMSYYFTQDQLEVLFVQAGFQTVNVEYVIRKTVNKKENIDVDRVFVQAKFRRAD